VIDWIIFLPLLTIGLLSSAHCIGMCGGIMGALTFVIPEGSEHSRWKILIAYNVGRITSYSLMGLLLGFFVGLFSHWGGGNFLRIIAGLLLISMGLYLADWWRGLTKLEHAGQYLWAHLQPLGKRLLPVDTLQKALLLGSLWGWLPCGLVYSALALAITLQSPCGMLAFGTGTLPAVLLAGVAAQQLARLLQRRNVRMGLALLIIIYGLWTIFGNLGTHSSHNHDSSGNHHKHNHESMDHSTMKHQNLTPGFRADL
jgi:sulfite exporter TauE/SafE